MTRQRIGLFLTLICLLLAGCGGSTIGAAAATSTPTTLPTVTPSATPKPTATQPPALSCSQALRGGNGVIQRGDLLITFTFGLTYPDRQLPDGLPLKPYLFTTLPPMDPAVNPHVSDPVGGFDLTICNGAAGASHALNSLAITIQSFKSYSGQVNTWNVCSTTYTRQAGATGGGCGGGVGDANCLQATFPSSATTGISASFAATNCTQHVLPVTLDPDGAYYANLGVTMPTPPGTYTLAVTFTVDGAAVTVPLADPLLIAPVAHAWDGNACISTSMQSQIPASDPTTPYVCPKG